MISREEQTRRRRRALLDAAREAFTEHGYEGALIEEIVRSIGVTRGTVYSQARDKAALFEAVYQEQCVALAHAIDERIQAAKGASRQQVVLAACQAFVDTAVDPRMWRILFMDGPIVLDRQVVRAPDPVLLLLRDVFEPLIAEGEITSLPLDPCIHLIWAMCVEAGIYIAHAADSAAARQDMVSSLECLLTGLWRE